MAEIFSRSEDGNLISISSPAYQGKFDKKSFQWVEICDNFNEIKTTEILIRETINESIKQKKISNKAAYFASLLHSKLLTKPQKTTRC